jgi:hypothetical protein
VEPRHHGLEHEEDVRAQPRLSRRLARVVELARPRAKIVVSSADSSIPGRIDYSSKSKARVRQAARQNSTEWGPYLGRYTNGAELICRAGGLFVRWKDREHALKAIDERLFASNRVSVGLLEGSPTMISVNDFILIGAQPGVLLEHL